MTDAASYEKLLHTLITPLLSEPAAVELRSEESRGSLVLTFRVHPDDTGRIIGKGGAGISSLREIIAFAGRRNGDLVALELEDD